MIEIIPSILTDDPNELKVLLEKCEGVVDRVQIDIVDGIFAANKTIDPLALENYEGNIKFDYHLMVKEPISWVEKCIRGGADRIVGQIELMSSQVDFIGKVSMSGSNVGLGIDLNTPLTKLESAIVNDLDLVLVMSVPAGFGGQKFDETALKKIIELDEIRSRDSTPFKIQDDGGITLSEINIVHFDGAEEAVLGRSLFEGSLADNIEKLQKAAHKITDTHK